jgi:hypothetical protein
MSERVSEAIRTEYRRALQRHGVPAVYAHMAAENLTTRTTLSDIRQAQSASALIYSGFVWSETKQGHQFWSAIVSEAILQD